MSAMRSELTAVVTTNLNLNTGIRIYVQNHAMSH